MPVPSAISDLSTTPSSNSPQGSETVGTQMNEYLQAAFAFIAQISGTLSTTYTPLGTLTAPTGTRMVMQQAAAPAGWTVDTTSTFTDCSMRFNQGAGSGGTANWSAWNYGNTINVSSTALTTAQMPAHNHGINDPGHGHSTFVSDSGHSHSISDPGHSHLASNGSGFLTPTGGSASTVAGGAGGAAGSTNVTGTNIGINLSGTGITVGIYGSATGISTQSNGSGQGHSHSFVTPQVKYADCIVAIKS